MFHSSHHHAVYKLFFRTIEEKKRRNFLCNDVPCGQPPLQTHRSGGRFHGQGRISLTLSDISKCLATCRDSTIYSIVQPNLMLIILRRYWNMSFPYSSLWMLLVQFINAMYFVNTTSHEQTLELHNTKDATTCILAIITTIYLPT